MDWLGLAKEMSTIAGTSVNKAAEYSRDIAEDASALLLKLFEPMVEDQLYKVVGSQVRGQGVCRCMCYCHVLASGVV